MSIVSFRDKVVKEREETSRRERKREELRELRKKHKAKNGVGESIVNLRCSSYKNIPSTNYKISTISTAHFLEIHREKTSVYSTILKFKASRTISI